MNAHEDHVARYWPILVFSASVIFGTGGVYMWVQSIAAAQAKTDSRVEILTDIANDTRTQLATMNVQLQMLNKQMETQTGGYGQSYAPRRSRFTDNAVEAPQ